MEEGNEGNFKWMLDLFLKRVPNPNPGREWCRELWKREERSFPAIRNIKSKDTYKSGSQPEVI